MTIKDKILCCHGNIKINKIHIVVGCSYARVYQVLTKAGLHLPKKRKHKAVKLKIKNKIGKKDLRVTLRNSKNHPEFSKTKQQGW